MKYMNVEEEGLEQNSSSRNEIFKSVEDCNKKDQLRNELGIPLYVKNNRIYRQMENTSAKYETE
jgi:hypothetical protein